MIENIDPNLVMTRLIEESPIFKRKIRLNILKHGISNYGKFVCKYRNDFLNEIDYYIDLYPSLSNNYQGSLRRDVVVYEPFDWEKLYESYFKYKNQNEEELKYSNESKLIESTNETKKEFISISSFKQVPDDNQQTKSHLVTSSLLSSTSSFRKQASFFEELKLNDDSTDEVAKTIISSCKQRDSSTIPSHTSLTKAEKMKKAKKRKMESLLSNANELTELQIQGKTKICKICNKSYTNAKWLDKHLEDKHNSIAKRLKKR